VTGRQRPEMPPRCGGCDPTRHVTGPDGRVRRCPVCHPLRDQRLAQHRDCPAGCGTVLLVTDHTPCSEHDAGWSPSRYGNGHDEAAGW
jgi:hypothetical protein